MAKRLPLIAYAKTFKDYEEVLALRKAKGKPKRVVEKVDELDVRVLPNDDIIGIYKGKDPYYIWLPTIKVAKIRYEGGEDYLLQQFVRVYLDSYGDGTIKRLAKRFGISEPTVQRLRRMLKMPMLFEKEHPGRRAVYKFIREKYYDGYGTEKIANMLNNGATRIHMRGGMCSQRVNQILRQMNVQLNPQHVINCVHFKTQSHLGDRELLNEIKRLYLDEHLPLCEIAERVGVWEGTVSAKLKAMGYAIITRRKMPDAMTIKPCYNIIGIYRGTHDPYVIWNFTGKEYSFGHRRSVHGEMRRCVWCDKEFQANISVGPRSQKFCNPKCKNKCKDLRRGLEPRYLKGKMRPASVGRFTKLALEFTGKIQYLGLPRDVIDEVLKLREQNKLGVKPHGLQRSNEKSGLQPPAFKQRAKATIRVSSE